MVSDVLNACMFRWLSLIPFTAAFLLATSSLEAHLLNVTRAEVAFDGSQQFQVTVYVDLTRAIGSGDAYYALSLEEHSTQDAQIRKLAAGVLSDIQFQFGGQTITPELLSWDVPKASKEAYTDYYMGKLTKLVFTGMAPDSRVPFVMNTSQSSTVEFPLALTVERLDHDIHVTRWLELPGLSSDPFNYDQGLAKSGSFVQKTEIDPLSGAKLTPFQRFWYVQFGALGRYLRLGFEHIVPNGYDHILFVLGLFFLGITWRKLISQTTVFTIAHATTLYLSTQGIFSLPSWLVEPGIAISITFIALENVFKPKLNAFRLVIVFFFGLIHGLGFASGLKDLKLPPHEFLMGLLGFNFGVDFGQLFIISLAFLLVGWFRKEPWYFSRIAVPGSLAIASMGAIWAVQRIVFYTHLAYMS